MQIHSIFLFSHDGRHRELKFRMNGVSIITGDSATGKSAIVEIIDYCFGSRESRVPEGIVRERVAWYGLKLASSTHGQLFVARRSPDSGGKSTHQFVIYIGETVGVPNLGPNDSTHNREGAVRTISEYIGIQPNETQISHEYSANYNITVRHAIKFCLQYQDEIASKRSLFHQQSEGFTARSIYDSLPYLLGLQAPDYLERMDRLRAARKELAEALRRLKEHESLASSGLDGGNSLIKEAEQVGLLKSIASPSTPEQILKLLETALFWSPEADIGGASDDTLIAAQQELASAGQERQALRSQIVAAESAAAMVTASEKEWKERAARLQSAELFPSASATRPYCPLCDQQVAEPAQLPRFRAVQDQFTAASSQLQNISTTLPDINKHVSQLRERLGLLDSAMIGLRHTIAELQRERADRSAMLDLSVRQAVIVGRIEQYLFGMRDGFGQGMVLRSAVRRAQENVDFLQSGISANDIAGQLDGISDALQVPMTAWAGELQLEFAPNPFRINFQDLTVEVSRNGRLPMYRMGSGKNWLGCHLISHFALHQYFLKHRRPVPNFLFLDQPTQVFYPPEEVDRASGETTNLVLREADPSEDRDIVQRIFSWIAERTAEFNKIGGFQVIITDHAELNTTGFVESLIDRPRWGTGRNSLVPLDWPSS